MHPGPASSPLPADDMQIGASARRRLLPPELFFHLRRFHFLAPPPLLTTRAADMSPSSMRFFSQRAPPSSATTATTTTIVNSSRRPSSAAFTSTASSSVTGINDSCAPTVMITSHRRRNRRSHHSHGASLFGCKLRSPFTAAILLAPLIPLGIFLAYFLLQPTTGEPAKKAEITRNPPEDALVRLPTDVVPVHYVLHLKVYLPYRPGVDFGPKNLTVDGNLRLHVLCRATTNVLLLHAKALKIEHPKTAILLENGMNNGGPRVVGWKELAGSNDLLELRLDKALLPGRRYVLEMGYTARVGRAHEGGLFHGTYESESGEKRLLAATQMQPLDARRLLPCFDEPSFKAEFSISVQHPEGTQVLSNTPIEHMRSVERGWTLSLFERTPKMATYLLALTVSDFQHKEANYNGIKIRVWAQPSKLEHTEHALEVAVRSLEYFEGYFGIPYPLKKLDIFGVPYLRVAAMENWGLILSRQQNLVYTEGVQAKRERQFVTDVLAHEIAHMWFGDLVTMEWWDDLWLNEGFATIMGMKAADYAENSTARTSQLFYEHTVKAFRYDQVAHQAHALSYKIASVREVARRFDRITYLKAAAVLRMVERTVGERLFKEGLRAFLHAFAYRNARSADLLRALSTVETNGRNRALSIVNFSLGEVHFWPAPRSEDTFNKFMDSWTYQTGFPLITVKATRNASVVTASQEQFFYLQPPMPNPSKWKVPLFFDTAKYAKDTVWMLEKETVVLPRGHLIDPKAHGYYRILYDADTYGALECTLRNNPTHMDLESRARLLEDSYTIARAGLLPFGQALRLTEYLASEREYLPFLVFNNHIQLVLLLLRNHPRAELIKEFIVQMLEPMYKRVFSPSFPPNDLSDTMREFSMIQLCHLEYAPCVNRSLSEFARIKKDCGDRQLSDRNCNSIAPELRGPIYGTAIRYGDTGDFEFLLRKYFEEQYDSERSRMFFGSGLVSTRDIRLVDRLLYALVANRKAFEEDFYTFLLKFVKSPIMNEIVAYMRDNFRRLAKKIPHPQIMKVVLTYVTKWLQSDQELRELDKFEAEHKEELRNLRLVDYLQEQKADIASNIHFMGTGAVQIFDYLEKRSTQRQQGRTKC